MAARVERSRRRLGLSQTDFGRLLGVNISTVSSWETEITAPDRYRQELLDAIEEGAKNLGLEPVSPMGLVAQEDEPSINEIDPFRPPAPPLVQDLLRRELREGGAPRALHLLLKAAFEGGDG